MGSSRREDRSHGRLEGWNASGNKINASFADFHQTENNVSGTGKDGRKEGRTRSSWGCTTSKIGDSCSGHLTGRLRTRLYHQPRVASIVNVDDTHGKCLRHARADPFIVYKRKSAFFSFFSSVSPPAHSLTLSLRVPFAPSLSVPRGGLHRSSCPLASLALARINRSLCPFLYVIIRKIIVLSSVRETAMWRVSPVRFSKSRKEMNDIAYIAYMWKFSFVKAVESFVSNVRRSRQSE